uniref:Uncharacterized protein n=1 Tax=Timema cristinae TaxID=61476 RepID=A0A7R9DFS5_TIMCR|nr:unnamed protein product [Timema cristinae]
MILSVDHGQSMIILRFKDPRGIGLGAYRPYLPTPLPLVELAADVVNKISLVACWYWSVQDVENWVVEVVNLPQYKDWDGHRSLFFIYWHAVHGVGNSSCGIGTEHEDLLTAA